MHDLVQTRPSQRRCILAGCALLLLLGAPLSASAAGRQALVIGNAAYQGERPLRNTLNDARDVAQTLRRLGFTLAGGGPLENADRRTLATAINRFLAQIQQRDDLALIYYAGHGMRDAHGATYLLPTDTRIEQEADIAPNGVSLTGIIDQLDQRPERAVSLVILDACRNNPFGVGGRGERRGLGEIRVPPRGTLVLYAASPGQTADDNRGGRNGLFTQHLLPLLATPGLDIEDAFDQVSLAVEAASGKRQVPWIGGNLRGQLTLVDQPDPAFPVPKMVRIQGDCFQMGSPAGEAGRDGDEGRHRVCVKDFALAPYEIQVGQFRRFVEATGYRTEAERNTGGVEGCMARDASDQNSKWGDRAWASWRKPSQELANRDDHPVSCVSWNDARAYIDWLNGQTGGGYRLPTEAEWEYAARAGTETARFWGEDSAQACGYANVADTTELPDGSLWSVVHACADGYAFASAAGAFKPNAWGLYDMLGNVWEWTCSVYDKDYGGKENQCSSKNDAGARAVRGGSWYYQPAGVRSADRDSTAPVYRYVHIGFRLAQD
ncbi:SUMF1/EgtB/PvdO family nonheme iron enzyme [Thiocystis violacea]|uniref:SUMF1/EgtB/PvdO family nonheme iron enzyme n=1 Tax=Thiocystis violacea TaxID=13725 RepID=UPI001905FB17|nr:SUMF1/EgtB/PvdO family nonheme iron enzyme [Thiocystis violacea]MBK1720100.1 hypothetical protein [Thiocystis violacea]